MGAPSPQLPQWVPLSVVKGGTSANLLVKSMETEWGRKLYAKTLVSNIGAAVYKDQDAIVKSVRASYPPLREAKSFEFAFKIRDKRAPESWYFAEGLTVIPPEGELEGTALDRLKAFFGTLGGGSSG